MLHPPKKHTVFGARRAERRRVEGHKGGREASTERGESDGRHASVCVVVVRAEGGYGSEGGGAARRVRRHLRLAAACTGATSRLSPSSRDWRCVAINRHKPFGSARRHSHQVK